MIDTASTVVAFVFCVLGLAVGIPFGHYTARQPKVDPQQVAALHRPLPPGPPPAPAVIGAVVSERVGRHAVDTATSAMPAVAPKKVL